MKIDDTYSDIQEVKCEAAQGTVLDPIIFILYFNYIASQVNKCKILMFADDLSYINLAITGKKYEENFNRVLI